MRGAALCLAAACQPAVGDALTVPTRVAYGGGARLDASNSEHEGSSGFVDEDGADGVATFDPDRGLIGVELVAVGDDGYSGAWLEIYADPSAPGGLDEGSACAVEDWVVVAGGCARFNVDVWTNVSGGTLATWAATARVTALDRDPLRLSVEVTGETNALKANMSGRYTLRVTELRIDDGTDAR
jgi:hypothetical protein